MASGSRSNRNTGETGYGNTNYAEGYAAGERAAKRYAARSVEKQKRQGWKIGFSPRTRMDNKKPYQKEFKINVPRTRMDNKKPWSPPREYRTRMDNKKPWSAPRQYRTRMDMKKPWSVPKEPRTRMDRPEKVYMQTGFPTRTNTLTWVIVFWSVLLILTNILDIDSMFSDAEILNPDKSGSYAELVFYDGADIPWYEKAWRGLLMNVDNVLNNLPFFDNFVPIFRIMTFRYAGDLPTLMGVVLNIIYMITIYEFIVIVGHLRG